MPSTANASSVRGRVSNLRTSRTSAHTAGITHSSTSAPARGPSSSAHGRRATKRSCNTLTSTRVSRCQRHSRTSTTWSCTGCLCRTSPGIYLVGNVRKEMRKACNQTLDQSRRSGRNQVEELIAATWSACSLPFLLSHELIPLCNSQKWTVLSENVADQVFETCRFSKVFSDRWFHRQLQLTDAAAVCELNLAPTGDLASSPGISLPSERQKQTIRADVCHERVD